ncbi:hypothetical protein DdX_19512 [Ditylenchus destructor]|uniref:Uncharacterized protein n=1 Tax=Ditylenchus destructor TaxID=166010 RepID=A0AAD4MI82_9BILA|nr:hypothetical protein DdX_19512 [Ditylenchus destructor]
MTDGCRTDAGNKRIAACETPNENRRKETDGIINLNGTNERHKQFAHCLYAWTYISLRTAVSGQKSNIGLTYYSFAAMRPYLGPTVRIKWTIVYVGGGFTYIPEHIEQMESIANLWRDGKISVWNGRHDGSRIVAEDFQSILNSPTILKCQNLYMGKAHFSFKDYKVLYAVNVIDASNSYVDTDPENGHWQKCWLEFLEEPEMKPVILIRQLHREILRTLLDRLSKKADDLGRIPVEVAKIAEKGKVVKLLNEAAVKASKSGKPGAEAHKGTITARDHGNELHAKAASDNAAPVQPQSYQHRPEKRRRYRGVQRRCVTFVVPRNAHFYLDQILLHTLLRMMRMRAAHFLDHLTLSNIAVLSFSSMALQHLAPMAQFFRILNVRLLLIIVVCIFCLCCIYC